MRTLRIMACILTGLLFIFSGYAKVIDPMGSAIKFGEYFEAFNMHAFIPGAFVFGVLLAVGELVIGICLFFSIKVKLISWAAIAFMLFFTLLTFVLAVFNPVSDCGCFGDAIKLTNWETFYKNLIILPIAIFIFIQRNEYKTYFSDKTEWFMLSIFLIYTTGIAFYSYRHLPLIDFMAYKVGNNIRDGRIYPEGTPEAEYDNTFIYEKDGRKQEFKIENLPDSTWTFTDAKSELIAEGYVPPMADFIITSKDGDFITDEILDSSGYMVFITSVDINEIKPHDDIKTDAVYEYCHKNNIGLMMLTGSSDEEIKAFSDRNHAVYPVYFVDVTVLKSMVRSNPGMMLLHDATILKKWSGYDIPSVIQFEKTIKTDVETLISGYLYKEKRDTVVLAVVLLIFVAIMFLIKRK